MLELAYKFMCWIPCVRMLVVCPECYLLRGRQMILIAAIVVVCIILLVGMMIIAPELLD